MAYNSTDLLKGFGMSEEKAQGVDWEKTKSYVGDFFKGVDPNISKQQTQEFKDTGTFSSTFQNQFKDYLKGLQTPKIEVPGMPNETGAGAAGTTGFDTGTGGTTGTDVIPGGAGTTGFDTGSTILDKELTDIQKDKNKAIEDYKKSFILGKADFEKNKSYYTNYDEVNNLYTKVLEESSKAMGNDGVIPDSVYQQIASKYGLTIDEVKNPNSILEKKAQLTEEGKKVLGQTKAEQNITDMEIERDRRKADIQTKLDQTIQQYDWQIEDVAKQLARNIGWTEAQGAWQGALRGSGYLQGIENIRKDGETIISRLKTLAEQVKSASEEDVARLTEDYNKAIANAKDTLNTQMEDLKKNSILALSEAQATYGMGSDKLMTTLEKINQEYGMKSNQAVSAYLNNLKSMNDLANQNISLVEKANTLETAKVDKTYNNYLANNGLLLQNANINDLAGKVKTGELSIDRFKDLQSIMTSSIQSTLGKLAPLTTQDIQIINTLLSQGYSPAEVVATMQEMEKFQASETISPKDRFVNVGGNLYDMVNETWVNEPGMTQTNQTTQTPTGGATGDLRGLASQFPNQAWAKNNNPAGITWNANFDNPQPGTTAYELQQAGVNFSKGTARPENEGGNYVTFDTIEDGLLAQRIMMEKTYGNSTVNQMLQSWVGTKEGPNYAKQVAGMAGITDLNQKVSDLTSEQLDTLQMAKIKKESPGLYGLLNQGPTEKETTAFKPESKSVYEAFLRTGKIGANKDELAEIVKEFGSTETFKKQANDYNWSKGGPATREIEKLDSLRKQVEGFISKENKGALDNSIGAWQWTANSKLPFSTRKDKENYLAGIQNFLDGKTLQQLIDVKEDGATFGALSNEELRMLQNSASELNQLALREDKDNPNKITGFSGTKENFERVVKETADKYKQVIENKKTFMNTGNTQTTGNINQVTGKSGTTYTLKPKKD